MRKITLLVAFTFCIFFTAFSQQDPMFTKYMFNGLVYNPAYAGSKDHMAIGVLHRTQWWGIDGAPTTQSFTMHTPLKNDRVGVGLSAVNDVVGPTNTMQANLSYAYRIPLGGSARLAVGLQGGVTNWRADWSRLELFQQDDEAFAEDMPNYWLPNFGGGLYFSTKRFYAGFASPHLIEYDLRQNVDQAERWAKTYRHYFFSMGTAVPLKGEMLVFRPSILVKNVGLFSNLNKDVYFESLGAPTEFDIDVSFLFYQALWVGASFRSAIEAFTDDSSFDSVDFWASYYLSNGLRIGAAYDYTLTELSPFAKGSFEVMLGYEFNYKTKRAVTPRYF